MIFAGLGVSGDYCEYSQPSAIVPQPAAQSSLLWSSIGLILCQDRNQIVAEYALRGTSKLIGVSEYELTRALPVSLQSALPTVEQIEAELGETQLKLPAPVKPAAKKKQPKR